MTSLTLPCPLCQEPVEVTWEPYDPPQATCTRPLLVDLAGCPHATQARRELHEDWPSPGVHPVFWKEVFARLDEWAQDQYSDRLEASAKWRRTER
jgi:hypothetical protein